MRNADGRSRMHRAARFRVPSFEPCAACSTSSSGVPADDELARRLAAFGADVDDPVGGLDHVEVVLDDQHRVAGVDEVVQHLEQQLDVGEVEAGRRLVEQVERAAGATSSPARGPA